MQLGRRSLRSEDWVEVAEKVSETYGGEWDEGWDGGYYGKWGFFKKMDMLLSPKRQHNDEGYLGESEVDEDEEDEEVDEEGFKLLAESIQNFGEIYEKIEGRKRQQIMELEKMRMDFQRELELQKVILERAQAEIARIREEDDEDANSHIQTRSELCMFTRCDQREIVVAAPGRFIDMTAPTTNAMSADTDDMISEVTYGIKKGLIFLGATTIKDKIQQRNNNMPTVRLTNKKEEFYLQKLYMQNTEQKKTSGFSAVTAATEPSWSICMKRVSKAISSPPIPVMHDIKVIWPAMPTAELLAALAKLTETKAELREVEVSDDDVLFIRPPPPVIVNEAASANDAERFEEPFVTRIMRVDVYNPYDVVGVDRNMVADNFKKRQASAETDHHERTCIWEIVSMLSTLLIIKEWLSRINDPALEPGRDGEEIAMYDVHEKKSDFLDGDVMTSTTVTSVEQAVREPEGGVSSTRLMFLVNQEIMEDALRVEDYKRMSRQLRESVRR
ncbi:hypothetical protein Tco_0560558, partial [Tanacetum coccineum]